MGGAPPHPPQLTYGGNSLWHILRSLPSLFWGLLHTPLLSNIKELSLKIEMPLREDAKIYHQYPRPGKLEIRPSKPLSTQRDISLAYSPGVGYISELIHKSLECVYDYTNKGNLVAVISNGTAVLGLGNLGPLPAKPVMEGKAILFKLFADIDAFDIEIATTSPHEFVEVVKKIAPTFGGINLEDIKAPECFEIEQQLIEELDIPVMHDDQHGTAVICTAALLNAAEIAGISPSDMKIVVNGAGASALATLKLFLKINVKKENIYVFDSKGVLSTFREDLNKYKKEFAQPIRDKNFTLEKALENANVFLGLSTGKVLNPEWIKKMHKWPIILSLANPEPEISWEDAHQVRDDIIMATGRSDYPNQVNNVLGFPFIFRGALDVKATKINDEMKLAAAYALAKLAKEPPHGYVLEAYNLPDLAFGVNYIIPKPMDPRLIYTVAPAVAEAAVKSNVARITDPVVHPIHYKIKLRERRGIENNLLHYLFVKAQRKTQKIVFAEGENPIILQAAKIAMLENICTPIFLGSEQEIHHTLNKHGIVFPEEPQILDPRDPENKHMAEEFANFIYQKRHRKGITLYESRLLIKQRNYFGACMVALGYADGFISGLTFNYANALRPLLQVIGKDKNAKVIAGMHILLTDKGPLFFADTTVNRDPSPDQLVNIIYMIANVLKAFRITPSFALLSYSNFGSSKKGTHPRKMREVLDIVKQNNPDFIIDGEIQPHFALNPELIKEYFPFSPLAEHPPNILIFPDLSSANISFKIAKELGKFESIGPILLGMAKSVHVLTMGSKLREIINMICICNVNAQIIKGD